MYTKHLSIYILYYLITNDLRTQYDNIYYKSEHQKHYIARVVLKPKAL